MIEQKARWVMDDGGRAAAGYRGTTGDCVTRAIAIAGEYDYRYVYDAMAEGNATQRRGRRARAADGKRTAGHGITIRRTWFRDWMRRHGWQWVPTMQIGSGCTTHLCAAELPPGRLVVQVSGHMTAVIDGIIHDLYDPSRDGTRCVYGYWTKSHDQT